MTNSHFRNAIAILSLAVLTAVVFVGAGSALGIGEPTQSPDNGNNISPTFNGLDVQGDIVNTAGFPNERVVIDDLLDVKNTASFTNDVYVTGSVAAESLLGTFGNFTDNLTAEKAFLLNLGGGTMINIGGNNNFDTKLPIINSDVIGGVPQAVNIADDLDVDSNLSVAGSTGITGSLFVTGDTKIDGTLDVGIIKNSGGPLFPTVMVDDGLTVTGTGWIGGGLMVVGNLDASASSVSANTLTVGGPAKASRFGTYTRVVSAGKLLAQGASGWASAACPAQSIVVSCGATAFNGDGSGVTFYEIDSSLPSTCYASAKNNMVQNKTFYSTAICLNSSL